jgi:probable O-glycosylation ligase (exosortase A-associated)
MILPLMNYLRVTTKAAWLRMGMLAAMGFTVLAIIGTYSRGALVALAVSGAAYAMKSRSGLLPLVLMGVVLIALPSVVPSNWFERMSTIKTAAADESFQERLQAWRTSWNLAEARPITGGGFSAIENNWVAQKYSSAGSLDIGRAAHSMYLEVLGDHGFVGLAIYLSILLSAWLNTSMVIRLTRDRPELGWANLLARMMQVSMLGYFVGGAGLSMAYYDGFLIVLSLTAALLATVYRYQNQREADAALEDGFRGR